MGRRSNSSSGEEDGDAEWSAAIDSVATDFNLTTPKTINASTQTAENDYQKEKKSESPTFKLYQIKAQKLLEDLLDKNLVMVRDPTPVLERSPERSEGSIRLFKRAPPGIIFDPIDAYPRPSKRPRIVPTEEIEEKSKKFRHRVESVAVDGIAIMAAAKDACQRSLTRFEAKDAAAKAAAKREEERTTELRRLRGEKWLSSIAREMQAQKLLEDLLDKNLVMVRDPTPVLERSPERSEGSIRLFKRAPPGIIFDPIDAYPRPSKRPRIVPTEEIEEKSKKRSLTRFEAKDAAAKSAAKREEERTTELRRLRGEKWLSSIAREMQVSSKVFGRNKTIG